MANESLASYNYFVSWKCLTSVIPFLRVQPALENRGSGALQKRPGNSFKLSLIVPISTEVFWAGFQNLNV